MIRSATTRIPAALALAALAAFAFSPLAGAQEAAKDPAKARPAAKEVRKDRKGGRPGAKGPRAAAAPAEKGRSVFKGDLGQEMADLAKRAAGLNAAVQKAQLQDGGDSVEKTFKGAGVNIARQLGELDNLRGRFVIASSRVKNATAAKADATPEQKAEFDKCAAHCDAALTKLNAAHANAALLATAVNKAQIQAGWEKHKAGLAEIEAALKDCPGMTQSAMACCKAPAAAPAPAVPAPAAAPAPAAPAPAPAAPIVP